MATTRSNTYGGMGTKTAKKQKAQEAAAKKRYRIEQDAGKRNRRLNNLALKK